MLNGIDFKILVNALLKRLKNLYDRVGDNLCACHVKVTAATKLLKNKLNVYLAGRTSGNVNLLTNSNKGECRGYTTKCQHLIGRLGCDYAVGLIGLTLTACKGDLPLVHNN